MEFGMLVSITNLMKHWKFQKDWLICHQVMTMESFQKSSCWIVDMCLLKQVWVPLLSFFNFSSKWTTPCSNVKFLRLFAYGNSQWIDLKLCMNSRPTDVPFFPNILYFGKNKIYVLFWSIILHELLTNVHIFCSPQWKFVWFGLHCEGSLIASTAPAKK